jgi:flagellar L-ring protein precursor FlgH
MIRVILLLAMVAVVSPAKPRILKKPEGSTIEQYIKDAESHQATLGQAPSSGSLYMAGGLLANTFRDLRASQVDDIVTILVADKASALSKGVTNTSRKSSMKYGIDAIAGPVKATSSLANLAGATGAQSLQGQGETSRENTLSTTLSARVTHVLPNGNLVVEALKNVSVNSENQIVKVRGVIRPTDVSPANTIPSDRVANLELRINGQGVVGDSVKRPFILYRILMGLLPF